jgi:hypothetical protein
MVPTIVFPKACKVRSISVYRLHAADLNQTVVELMVSEQRTL